MLQSKVGMVVLTDKNMQLFDNYVINK
jgi:hypothetical protein